MSSQSETKQNNKVRYELLRPQQIIAARDKVPVAYIPIGPMEWHGLHLPLGVDMLHAYTLALATAREIGGVVLPPLPLGSESFLEPDRVHDRGFTNNERIEGMDFPGLLLPSLYIKENAIGVIVRDIVNRLKTQGFRVIAIVNGHGAQYHLLSLIRIAVEETEPGKVVVLHTLAFDIGPGKGGHAERFETGFMQAYFPDTVDLQALPPLPTPLKNTEVGILDGPTCDKKPTPDYTVRLEQDPRVAKVEEGNEDVVTGVKRISKQVLEALETWSDPKASAWTATRILGYDFPARRP